MHLPSAAVLAGLLFVLSPISQSFAQVAPGQGQAPAVRNVASSAAGYASNVARYKIAVIDVSAVFKNYNKFKNQDETLKKEQESKVAELDQSRRDIISLSEQIRDHKPGTPGFKQLDEKISTGKAQLKLAAERHQKDYIEKKLKIYQSTFDEIESEVKKYAMHKDIALVVRFTGEPIDPTSAAHPNQVMSYINKPIIFQNNIDITQDIINNLNARAAMVRRPNGQAIPGQR